MSAKKVNRVAREFFIYTFFLFILFLAAININNFIKPKEVNVLGVETQTDSEPISRKIFWEGFLKNHPNYIPGWIEIGRIDKVREIDPNYF